MLNVDAAVAALCSADLSMASGGWPDGAPVQDFLRSPIAARVGQLAAESGLFCAHYEHRVVQELPEAWVVPGREGDAEPPAWTDDGILPERKYAGFRLDQLSGSFHPGHRGKWTTHELCHGLIGTAWHPGASPLFHATASRMAELLPVVLYYVLDEVGLTRCPRHTGAGARYHMHCADCERLAMARVPGADEVVAAVERANAYLQGELAAIERTVQTGVPHPFNWGHLELCSDGLAYGLSHGGRLCSDAYGLWWSLFAADCPALHTSLPDLRSRVEAVARALVEGAPLAPLAATPAAGRDWLMRQDIAWRLLTVWADCDGEVADALLGLVQGLAGHAGEQSIRDALTGYGELFDEVYIPEPALVFAVGYDLPGGSGRSVAQLKDGLQRVVPLTLELADDASIDLVSAFSQADPLIRAPLGRRFSVWMDGAHPGQAADLSRFEAMTRNLSMDPLVRALGPGPATGLVQLADNMTLCRFECDVVRLAQQVESGSVMGGVSEGRLSVGLGDSAPMTLAMGLDPAGELLMVDVPLDTAAAIEAANGGPIDGIDADDREALCALGVLRPSHWPL